MELVTRRKFMQRGATTAAAAAVAPLKASSQDDHEKSFPFSVVFEVRTTPETHQAYLETAQKLRPMLDGIPGFISIERSASLTEDHMLLSLSYWADEAALVQWRSTGEHHAAQQAGRDGIFADYRLRVGQVLTEEPLMAASLSETPAHYNRPPFHARQYMSIVRIESSLDSHSFGQWLSSVSKSVPEIRGYRSLSNAGRYYLGLPSGAFANLLQHAAIVNDAWAKLNAPASTISIQIIEVERDYGMEVREQAPQFFRATGHAASGGNS